MGPLARVVILFLCLAAGGCGSGNLPASPPRVEVTITYWPEGRSGESHAATLTCGPDGGTHPEPASACDALLAHEDALDPVPTDVACTQIYGGDQVARVSGGRVDASFSRVNGCEIARWDKLAPLLELSG